MRALADAYEPVTTQIKVFVTVSNAVDNANSVANVKTTVEIGGQKYEATTETSYNPETEVATTTGNVTSSEGGKTGTLPVSVSINAKGDLVGSIGNAGVTASAPTTVAPAPVVTPSSVQTAESNNVTLPDSTVVTSSTGNE